MIPILFMCRNNQIQNKVAFMKQIESNHIEFKKCYVDDLDKDIIAFLNSQGGRIYIGIEDNGHIIGIPKFEQDDLNLKVANIISDSIYPNSRDFIKGQNLQEFILDLVHLDVKLQKKKF